jgi:hypothetical protein
LLPELQDEDRELLNQAKNPEDPTWIEIPIPFPQFVTDAYHMGQAALTPVQQYDIEKVLGSDPLKIFSGGSSVNLGVLLWGKGSGKDWVCSMIQCYIIYVLMCMRDPAGYFRLARGFWLDCINISISKDHGEQIYYEYFKDKITHWPWLWNRYSVYEGNKLLIAEGNKKGKTRVDIIDGMIEFHDKKIRAVTKGSDANLSEGFSPIFFVCDEFAAFKDHTETMNGDKILKTLKSSATSRFGFNFKGFLISWPRAKNDCMMRQYDKAIKQKKDDETGANMYGSRHTTWEVRPEGSFGKRGYFEFKGMKIPMEFWQDFQDDPEDASSKYLCMPPEVEDAFFKFQDRILECIRLRKPPLFTTQSTIIERHVKDINTDKPVLRKYIGQVFETVFDRSLATRKIPRVIHVDCGLVKDNAAMVVAHGEDIQIQEYDEETGKMVPTHKIKVVVDAIIIWQPNKSENLQVSINNIETLIIDVAKIYKIVKVSYDQWNSQSSLETLQGLNIAAEMHTINDHDYGELKTMIYNNAVELLPNSYMGPDQELHPYQEGEMLLQELLQLRLLNGKRVDHPKEGSKDIADCLAGVNRLLNDPKEKKKTRPSGYMPRSILGNGLSRATPMPFSPSMFGVTQDLPVMPGRPKTLTPATGEVVNGYTAYAGQRQRANNPNVEPSYMVRRMPRPILGPGTGGGMRSPSRSFNSGGGRGNIQVPGHIMR